MFTFHLQTVLDYRQVMERRFLQAYAEKVRLWEEEKNQLEHWRKRRTVLEDHFRRIQEKEITSDEIASLSSFLEKVRDRILNQEQCVQRAAEEMEKKRKDLLEAMKRRKVLEILKEKRRDEHRRELTRKECKRLDEFGIDQYRRDESKEVDRGL